MKHLTIIIMTLSFVIASCEKESEVPGYINQTEQVRGQGFEGSLVNGSEANIFRKENNGFFVDLTMPIPEAGSYDYPEGAEEGHPEVFTLWIFVFNDPEAEDFDAVYLGSAHVAEDTDLIELNGHVTSESEPFTGDGHLTDPLGAKVRLAVAPHGELNSNKLPGQLTTPSGGPDHWWIAEFGTPSGL